jgi:hypothetical protein
MVVHGIHPAVMRRHNLNHNRPIGTLTKINRNEARRIAANITKLAGPIANNAPLQFVTQRDPSRPRRTTIGDPNDLAHLVRTFCTAIWTSQRRPPTIIMDTYTFAEYNSATRENFGQSTSAYRIENKTTEISPPLSAPNCRPKRCDGVDCA